MACVIPVFEKQESLEVAASTARETGSEILRWGHPISESLRRAIPITAGVMVARAAEGSLYHVTASREYPSPPHDEGCFGWSVVNTWVRDTAGELSVIGSRLDIDNCDGKSIDSDTPLIALYLNGRTFVIVDGVGYEWATYTILEWISQGPQRVFQRAYHCL